MEEASSSAALCLCKSARSTPALKYAFIRCLCSQLSRLNAVGSNIILPCLHVSRSTQRIQTRRITSATCHIAQYVMLGALVCGHVWTIAHSATEFLHILNVHQYDTHRAQTILVPTLTDKRRVQVLELCAAAGAAARGALVPFLGLASRGKAQHSGRPARTCQCWSIIGGCGPRMRVPSVSGVLSCRFLWSRFEMPSLVHLTIQLTTPSDGI